MSAQGSPPAPPRNASTGGSSSDVFYWVIGAAVALLLALAAVLVVALNDKDSTELASGPETTKPASYPPKWHYRIAPYAKITEDLRDLDFKHPVKVRFLPADKFDETVTADAKKLSGEDRTEIEQFTGLMRAFGLISGKVDLFAAVNDFRGAGTMAYYSFDDKTITIRGERLTPSVRSTLVHELTHALQDQHFALGDRKKQLRKETDDGPDTSDGSVLDAITEGDASRVQTLYRDSLTAKQRTALDADQQSENTQATNRMKKIPNVITTLLSSPYTLGQALVATAAANGGNNAVNGLFRDTPKHESSLLNPFQVLAADTTTPTMDTPKLRTGQTKFDSGEFGVLTWYLMLAERLPLRDALAAADGWGADAYVAYQDNDTTCARIDYAGKRPRDTTRMFSALQRWDAAAPDAPVQLSRDAGVLHFESCDPGEAAHAGGDNSGDAITLATARTYIGITIMNSGVPAKTAECMAGRLAQAFPLAKLVDPTYGANDPAVQARARQVTARCR